MNQGDTVLMRYRLLLLAVLAASMRIVSAAEIAIPLPIDYRLVRDALAAQVYRGPDETVVVYQDKWDCNAITLSTPRIEDGAAGRIRVVTTVTARGGTPLPTGSCLAVFKWKGVIEVIERTVVQDGIAAVGFKVVDSNILTADEAGKGVPGLVWNWIEEYVNPRLESFSFSLQAAIDQTRDLLRGVLDLQQADSIALIDSLHLADATGSVDALDVTLSFVAPEPPPGWTPPVVPPLSEAELARWDEAWQSWDGFATWMIKYLATGVDPELRAVLAEILIDARYDLRDALSADARAADPIRVLFLKTWTRLTPILRKTQAGLPAADALRYVSFISAADALRGLDAVAPQIGFAVSSDTLRQLARTLLPTVSDTELEYNTAVDPQLRSLLGLDPDLLLNDARPSVWDLLIPAAHAAGPDSALAAKLNDWLPTTDELDAYLAGMNVLLGQIAESDIARGKVQTRFADVYRSLIRTTAWQETCWRQYEKKNGEIRTIQSAVGSVGLMQVNKHVWRGVYDLNRLVHELGYNAAAGNEILVHYLVDFAIKKGEHKVRGNLDDLARASYAVYNGGPGQLTRYRIAETKSALKKIDNAFWKKYQTLKKEGPTAVKQCYGL